MASIQKDIRAADKHYNNGKYDEAFPLYKKIVDQLEKNEPNSFELFTQISNLYSCSISLSEY